MNITVLAIAGNARNMLLRVDYPDLLLCASINAVIGGIQKVQGHYMNM